MSVSRGASRATSRFAESRQPSPRTARGGVELLAFLVFSAGGCTAAGEFEPILVGSDRGAAGAADSLSPSTQDQATAGRPVSPAPVLDPEEAASADDAFPVDTASDSSGSTGSATDSIDTGSDAGVSDARDAGSHDGGSARDASAPPSGLDASAPPSEGTVNEPDASAPPKAPCPGLVFEGSCYEFFDEQVSWSDAESRCAAWGGQLASVESPEEDAFMSAWPALMGVPLLNGAGLWLGGTDAIRDGDFRWQGGRPLGFTGWAPGQPNDGAGVDCIEKRNDYAQGWYDRRCTDGERYVCERPE
jgi:hypothetical protein